jgi:hypothetical protein
MRRGSLSERTIKCSKPGCACAQNPSPRHGPYYSLTRAIRGKTQSRFLTAEQAALAREQIAAGRAFRTKLEAYWEGCEDWADRQLDVSSTASAEEAGKRGLQTDLQKEIAQEIETLSGRQPVAELDLEAVEMAARRQALRLAAHAL